MCNNHRSQYNNERIKRWGMAKAGEQKAANSIANTISEITNCNVEFNRYDEIWFSRYEPNNANEWVKGASDYYLSITTDNGIYNLYTEIKIKAQEFRKTTRGGVTPQGSNITRYGCTSYYLDIVPVYRNMNDFCNRVGLDPNSFLICFINQNYTEINVISLAELNDIINNGWNGIEICIYGEGYGQKCYLIPKQATHNLASIDLDILGGYCDGNNLIVPE